MKRVVLLLFIPLAVAQATGIIRNEKGDEICLTKSCITNGKLFLIKIWFGCLIFKN